VTANRSIDFFDKQFRQQAQDRHSRLNPFEQAALPYPSGRVLDCGCGPGNRAGSVRLHARGGSVVTVVVKRPAAP